MTKRYFSTFFLLIVSTIVVWSQSATLSGKLIDLQGKEISDVSIEVIGDGFSKLQTTSNSNGNYLLKVPANSKINVFINHVSFYEISYPLYLEEGMTHVERHQLKKREHVIIIDVKVDGKTKPKPGEINIKPKVYEGSITVNDDATSILNTLPSVSQNNELSSQYSVRGGNFDENLIYVNDIEVYRPFLVRSGQQEGLSFANPDLIKSLTFSAGGFESKYGDKLSSVLDIKYRDPDSLGGSVTASILGARFHLENKSKNERFSYIMGGRYKSNSYVLGSLDTQGEYAPRFFDYQTYINYFVRDDWTLSFLGNISQNKYIMNPVSRTTNFGTFQQAIQLRMLFDGSEKDEFTTFFGAISSNHTINNNLSLKFTASAFQSYESETFDINGRYSLSDLETNFGDVNFGEATYSFGAGGVHEHSRNYLESTVANFAHRGLYVMDNVDISWGAKLQHEIIDDEISEWTLLDSAGYSMPQAPNDEILLSEVLKTSISLESNRIMGFYQMDFDLDSASQFNLSAGIRANYWDYNHQLIVSPRAILTYNPIPDIGNDSTSISWRFATGYYQQPPFYRELRNFEGVLNPELRAQTSIHFITGYDYYFKMWGKEFKWSGDMYYKHLKNLVPYVVDNVRIRYHAKNESKGYAAGVESKIYGEFIPGLESWFSIGVMKTMEDINNDDYYFYNAGDTVTAQDGSTQVIDTALQASGFIPRPTDQRINLGIFFQDEFPSLPAFKVHITLNFGTGVPFGSPDAPKYYHINRMPTYRRVDMGFSYQVVKDGMMYKGTELLPMKSGSVFKPFHTFFIRAEIFNLLGIQNTISYFWVKDINNQRYGVPNYLTNRLINIKLIGKF